MLPGYLVLLVLMLPVTVFLWLVSLYNFALYHTTVEFITIAISVAIFLLVWKSRKIIDNNYLLFIGITFVFIAILDFLHTLVYQGVGIFPDGGGALSTRFWIAARYLQAVTFLAAPLFIRRNIRFDLVAITYLAADVVIVASIFIFNNFPVTYIPGTGLTPFKIVSEYIISLLLIASVVLLYHNRTAFDREVFDNLVIAIFLIIASELTFTEYASFVDIFSLLGHVFRLVAYFFFYRAIIEVGQEKPYNLIYHNLTESEKKYRALSDLSPDAILVMQDGIVRYTNNAGLCLSGVSSMEALLGNNFLDFIHPDERARSAARIAAVQEDQVVVPLKELRVITGEKTLPVEATGGPVTWEGKKAVQVVIRDITQRKQAEEALREAHQRTATILEGIADTFYSLDNEWRFTTVNPAAEKAPFSRPAAELLGRVIWELYPDFVGTRIHRHYLDAAEKHSMEHYEAQSPINNRWYEVFMQGRNGGVDVYMRDISDRKRVEEALRETSQYLDNLINYANAPIIVWDPAFRITRFNHAFELLTGMMADEAIGQNLGVLFPDQDRAGSMDLIQRTIGGEQLEVVEIPIRRKDGSVRVVLWNSATIFEKDGTTISSTIAQGQDITERKIAEAENIRVREEWERTFNTVPDLIAILDTKHRIIRVNRAMADRLSTTPEKCRGLLCHEAVHGTTVPPEFCPHAKTCADGKQHVAEVHEPGLGGTFIVSTTPLFAPAGDLLGTVHVAHDITERKRAEEALRQSEALARERSDDLASLIEAVPAAVWIAHDPLARHISGNALSDDWLRIPHGAEASKSAPEGIRPETFRMFRNGRELQPSEMPVQRSAGGAEIRDYEFDFVYMDGKKRTVLGNSTPLVDADGNPRGSVSSYIDITGRKQAEEELQRRHNDLSAAYEEIAATQEELQQNVEELSLREQELLQSEAMLKDALAEKEILLSEIHHRVKNNLAAFISLLSLDGTYEDTDAGRALRMDLQNRARSMALIHETLYRTGKFSKVDMEIYLTTLIRQIADSFNGKKVVNTVVDARGVVLDLARATTAGLIINELVTNSFKYAFPASFNCMTVRGEPCTIRVSFVEENGTLLLTVADNGRGLPADLDPLAVKSLGLKLVSFLGRHQLRAEIAVRETKGTEFIFRLDKPEDHQ
jgi:PAS domain S-box-containing protein